MHVVHVKCMVNRLARDFGCVFALSIENGNIMM